MDIKDFILIGGGLLIAAVVAHGFWIAWRERRQDLRIDIKPDLIPDDVDDIVRLRGELPNGGARVAKPLPIDGHQDAFDLETELAPPEKPAPESRPGATPQRELRAGPLPDDLAEDQEIELIDDSDYEVSFTDSYRPAAAATRDADGTTAKAGGERAGAPGASREAGKPSFRDESAAVERREPQLGSSVDSPVSEPRGERPADRADTRSSRPTSRPRVREVAMPEPIVADRPRRSRRSAERKAAEAREPQDPVRAQEAEAPRPAVEELIVMNVLAETPYTGDELFAVLRGCGLKFGEMNIFHRIEPLTRVVNYSIASAVEPGTFDMADMEAIRCPGLCLFMQLPGPEDPVAAFEDMLSVARSITGSLKGEIKDEQRNVMTPQTVEHYRQKILDFSRRRMSKRA